MVKRIKTCDSCNSKAIRIDEFDSYACKSCVIWIDNKCSYDKCSYCSKRPETPKDVDWDDPWNGK